MRQFRMQENGFTLIEFVVIAATVTIVLTTGLLSCISGGGKPRESEVKANIHTIQIALERYNTDNNEYPHYLLGGDTGGWTAWHSEWDGKNSISMPEHRRATNNRVQDPLIQYAYLSSYPHNPFVDSGSSIIAKTSVEGLHTPGKGDPRFGMNGDIMGQGLDDMNFFRGANHPGPFFWSEIETRRTLDHGEWMKVPEAFINPDTDMYYLFGGRRNPKGGAGSVLYTFWPGDFFYKATTDIAIGLDKGMIPVPNTDMGGRYNRYILGGYGAEGTRGTDVIRLEPFDPAGNRISWQCPPAFGPDQCFQCGYELFSGEFNEPGGLPEVFGGGDATNGPWYPYATGGSNPDEFIYGSPDGIPDGVILVLTNSSEQRAASR